MKTTATNHLLVGTVPMNQLYVISWRAIYLITSQAVYNHNELTDILGMSSPKEKKKEKNHSHSCCSKPVLSFVLRIQSKIFSNEIW